MEKYAIRNIRAGHGFQIICISIIISVSWHFPILFRELFCLQIEWFFCCSIFCYGMHLFAIRTHSRGIVFVLIVRICSFHVLYPASETKKMDFGPWTISYEPYFHFFIYLFTSLAGIFSRLMIIFCTYTFNPFIKIEFLRCNGGERD